MAQFEKSDKIDAELAIPYVHTPDVEEDRAASKVLGQSLPMLAMFLRSKPIAWLAFFTTIQAYLNEPEIRDPSATPASMNIITGILSIGVAYSDFVLIPTPKSPPPPPVESAKD